MLSVAVIQGAVAVEGEATLWRATTDKNAWPQPRRSDAHPSSDDDVSHLHSSLAWAISHRLAHWIPCFTMPFNSTFPPFVLASDTTSQAALLDSLGIARQHACAPSVCVQWDWTGVLLGMLVPCVQRSPPHSSEMVARTADRKINDVLHAAGQC